MTIGLLPYPEAIEAAAEFTGIEPDRLAAAVDEFERLHVSDNKVLRQELATAKQ